VFERFTDRARRVLVLAQEEARLLDHGFIGTEHILLGLLSERDGVAGRALTQVGVSLDAARAQVKESIGLSGGPPAESVPFTPRAKKVLELSLREALRLGHNYIGTEHMLLGLLREGEGVSAQVLANLGAEPGRVRHTVTQLLAGHRLTPPEPALGAEGVVLRPFRRDDRLALSDASRDPLIQQYTFLQPVPTESDMQAWVDNKLAPWREDTAMFAIADSESNHLLGGITLHVERDARADAGFWVVPSERRRGVASRALGTVADWAFDHQGIDRLALLTNVDNEAAQAVATRCGFMREGVLRAYQQIRDERPDLVSWSLLPDDPRPWVGH